VLGKNQAVAPSINPVASIALTKSVMPVDPSNTAHAQPPGFDQIQLSQIVRSVQSHHTIAGFPADLNPLARELLIIVTTIHVPRVPLPHIEWRVPDHKVEKPERWDQLAAVPVKYFDGATHDGRHDAAM
jgi:hypothetical protein